MHRRAIQLVAVAAVLSLAAAACAPASRGGRAEGPAPAPSAADRVTAAFGRLPARFEENRGQVASGVDFVARGPGYTALLSATEASLGLGGGAGPVTMRLVGAAASSHARTGARLGGATNYLRGTDRTSWLLDVPSYSSVTYPGAYPGIDVVYRSADGGLKYDFVVEPGADPGQIALGFDAAVHVDASGDLVVPVAGGQPVRHEKPVVYQEAGGRRLAVEARYEVGEGGLVRFALGSFDRARPLVIDPAIVYSTFLGGPVGDGVHAIAVDGAGNAYVTGVTTSTDFPTLNPAQGTKGAGASNDAIVTKFNPTGNGLVYSTFLGGGLADAGNAIAVDAAGNAYVAGTTASTNFPTASPLQAAKGAGANDDAFVAKLNAAGNALVFSTYLGGGAGDTGTGVTVDGAGIATVAGTTSSANLPTAAPLQAALAGGSDAYVARINAAGSALVYSTYLGGTGDDTATGLARDGSGNAYVTGSTASTNFPTANPFQNANGGGTTDAYVANLNAAGSALVYSTYLGGSLADAANAIAVDAAGAAYVTGPTSSTNFPVASPFQGTKGAGPESDAFVTKLAPAGNALAYSTYLGSPELDSGSAIAVDGTGSAHVSGITLGERFPVERPLSRFVGNQDAFITRLAPNGGSLAYSTHYGGLGSEDPRAITTDASQATYVGGLTSFARVPEYFPTVNAFQTTFGGGFVPGTPNSGDGFVAKFTPDPQGRPLVTNLLPKGGDTAGGTSVIITGAGFTGASAVRFGDTAARSFAVESDTRIVAVTPTLAEATHKVTVTTAGGTSPANPVSEFWAGEGSWALTGALNTPRSAHTSTLLDNGKVLVAGGRVSAGGGLGLASAELYDPITGTWSNTGSMATARWSHSAVLLDNGKVLVAGGYTATTTIIPSAELYDPATGTWSTVAPMATARGTFPATLVNGPNCGGHCNKVLVTGGRTGANNATANSTELYDPVRNVWEASGNLNEGRYLTQAVVVGDGRVLVAGGFGPTDTAETWNPATGTWTFTPALPFAKARPTLTRLADGNVLVNNGWANGPVPSAEIFDYRTTTFRPARVPITHRWNATAVLLPNSKVLAVAGGVGGATAEVYDPRTDSRRSAGSLQFARGASSVTAAGPGGTAVLLSSSTAEFQADVRVCGQNCGKVLIVGNTDEALNELYTPTPAPGGPGYWLTASDGGVFAFGDARFFGSTGSIRLNRPVVGMAATPAGRGYFLVASDGGVFAFGDARFQGSTGAIPLNQPVVGIARTPSGLGYWLVAADGGVFAFGDARFFGSTGAIRLNSPVVGIAATPTGRGYWMVAADGGVFAFGDARFFGSTGAIRLNRPMVGMAPTVNGRGYWLVASDGGVFSFGDATFRGSTGAIRLNQPIVGMAATPSPLVAGYWLVASDGGVFSFGDARFSGSTGAIRLNRPMVGMAANPPPPPS